VMKETGGAAEDCSVRFATFANRLRSCSRSELIDMATLNLRPGVDAGWLASRPVCEFTLKRLPPVLVTAILN